MDDDSTWVFNAPQHYCDLPSAFQNDDSEMADQYFFGNFDNHCEGISIVTKHVWCARS